MERPEFIERLLAGDYSLAEACPDWMQLRAYIEALEKDAARWRTIETAPKDGAWIMAYGPDLSITAYPAVIFWDDGWCPAHEGQPSFRASHWMPLPAPPTNVPATNRRVSADGEAQG